MKKIKIGIDFDKVLVDYPPVVPSALIEYLYKRRNRNLSYRFPGKLEQKIRIASHTPFLRPPIKTNIESLKKINEKQNCTIYLVSSRFSFLRNKTEIWKKKNNIEELFEKMYFNFNNRQPHIFKDEIIKKEGIEKFVDDDLDLLIFLAGHNPKVEFYWLTSDGIRKRLPSNIFKVKNLEEFRVKYLQDA